MKPGDKVNIKTKDKEYVGILMPSSSKKHVVLKLDNGYNIGIEKTAVKSANVIQAYKEKKQQTKEKIQENKSLKTIAILHTGGTIASKVDYETGAVISRFEPEELLAQFPELKKLVNIKSRLLRQMFSENMRFGHYNLIAREIKKEIENGADGIIVTHGTDTMHYTSAALSFILENLSKPVILVGAQRSSDRGSSDAAMNLICAARFIAETDFAGVAICMHKSMNDDICIIIPGTKARKLHSSRRDAFKPINTSAIAEICYKTGNITFISKEYARIKSGIPTLKLIKDKLKVGIIKAHPNMHASELLAYKNFDGLILEGTGLGHYPIMKIDNITSEHIKILDAIKTLAKKMPVVMTTQTIFGRINMNVYAPGRMLQDAGVIGNMLDITTETAFVKLAWLLSNHPKQVRELFEKNLRGEISETTSKDFLD